MPPKVLPTPLELTRSVRDVSVTERNSFKQCRRRWYLETIENLEQRGGINWAFALGTGVHAGLEAYYKSVGGLIENDDPLDACLLSFQEWVDKTDEEIVNAGLGSLGDELRDELLGYKELGFGMLDNYDKFAALEDDFTVCAVEGEWTEEGLELIGGLNPPYEKDVHPVFHESGRFMVPIVHPDTKLWIPNQPFLSARLDLIVYVNTPGLRGFWVYDHKTAAQSPSDRGIEMDDQVTGYSYTFFRRTGFIPRGTIFNYLIKQLPKEPRLVREGKDLSAAKDQLTTAPQYKEAMQEFGYMKGNQITSAKHAECYEALLAHGWGRFFQRKEVPKNEHEIMMFEKRLVQEYADMTEAYQNPEEKIYPHLSQYNCPGCPVLPICQAIEDGSDYTAIIESRYQQAPDRKAA